MRKWGSWLNVGRSVFSVPEKTPTELKEHLPYTDGWLELEDGTQVRCSAVDSIQPYEFGEDE